MGLKEKLLAREATLGVIGLGYLALTAATGALIYVLVLPFSEYTLVNFLVRLLLCLVVPNGLWFLLFRKNENFLYLRDTAFGILRGLKKKFRKI